MDLKKLEQIISFYKKHYKEIRLRENYKWEAAAEFKRADFLHAEDFSSAFKEAYSGTGNLLDSGYYFPRTNLFLFLKKDPVYLKKMFEYLYDEDMDPYVRIRNFITNAWTMQHKYFTAAELPDHDQDEHAVSVYLFLQYPEKYYIYRYTTFHSFAREIDYSYIPPRKSDRNLPEFFQFCEGLRKYIIKDRELLKLEEERQQTYKNADPAYHLLTQDILICGTTYFRHPELFGRKDIPARAGKFKQEPVREEMKLAAIPFYDPVEIMKYETELLDAAAGFILEQEKIRVSSYRIAVKKKPERMQPGEGADISSFDRHGNRIYIAVKATAGAENDSFEITEAERLKSRLYPEQYYLYRVFRFSLSSGTGEYSVRRGDLSSFCINSDRYRVVFKTE